MKRIILFGLVSAQVLTAAVAQTWCGKHYMSSQSIVVPGGNFPPPAASKDPLLAFRCAPAIRPYLAEDASSPAAVLIDSPVVYYEIANTKAIYFAAGSYGVTNAHLFPPRSAFRVPRFVVRAPRCGHVKYPAGPRYPSCWSALSIPECSL